MVPRYGSKHHKQHNTIQYNEWAINEVQIEGTQKEKWLILLEGVKKDELRGYNLEIWEEGSI